MSPASARAIAHPRPMPDDAPVIRAVLLSNLNEGEVGRFIVNMLLSSLLY